MESPTRLGPTAFGLGKRICGRHSSLFEPLCCRPTTSETFPRCCSAVIFGLTQSRDPVISLSEHFVMAGRVATILRGLAYAVKHRPSVAKLWAPQARQLLAEYDRLQAKQRSSY